ncbi:hypothetical protein [Streptomyces tateyamensis]|uniref:hypothetical protein n=1 Tax=Streptomyces tateyamensis TaxID=565073 RepID=UPI0015E8B161|nr:hypothetical protein [Streptomyces tateyamensis]
MRTSIWFDLHRHDDPTPPAPPTPTGTDSGADDEAALGDAGKRALERVKAERAAAKAEAAAEKQRADDLAAKVAAFEDEKRTDLEKAQAAADTAAKQAAAATARAVRAEVKAMAATSFADPSDATALLDLTQYTSSTGEIDAARIATDLAALLQAKPHLAKPATTPAGPRPDAGQGARPPAPTADFRTADRTAFAAELAKYGIRL